MKVPTDVERAGEAGAMCGHGALAAALEMEILPVLDHLEAGWVNVPRMKAAIRGLGRMWWRFDMLTPRETGVALIQFEGPWTEPGVPPAAACQYRHWIAQKEGLIWDINWPEQWLLDSEWKKLAPELLPDRCTGLHIWGVLKIT